MIETFKELNIKEETMKELEFLGIEKPSEIQKIAIPEMIAGKDIIAQAQTGTGKTFAFAIPILEKIKVSENNTQALIICPTRELANQVFNEFNKLISKNSKVKISVIYGGESYNKQLRELKKVPHIIISTPGRTIDHINRKTLKLNKLETLVLDEADEMLKMGFIDELEQIFFQTPNTRQTALFSATMPKEIRNIAAKYQKDAKMLKVENKTLTVSKIDQSYYFIKKEDRNNILIRILDTFNPESAIIFCNTKNDVDNLVEYLQKRSYEADAIHGDLNQSQREVVMKRFKNKNIKLLVATDVAARGIDVKHLDYVINYELPFENELYVHRIGRTGRAGKLGNSISLVYPSTMSRLKNIENYIKETIEEKQIPTVDEIYKNQRINEFENIKRIIDENNKDYNSYIEDLLEEGYDLEKIVNGLISSYFLEFKNYPKIDTPRKRQNKNVKSRKGFVLYQINLGKKENIKPLMFLDFVRKSTDMYSRNIGDITIKNNETIFEVSTRATKRIQKIDGKFLNGKKIKLKKL